jgi:hypothetical protein
VLISTHVDLIAGNRLISFCTWTSGLFHERIPYITTGLRDRTTIIATTDIGLTTPQTAQCMEQKILALPLLSFVKLSPRVCLLTSLDRFGKASWDNDDQSQSKAQLCRLVVVQVSLWFFVRFVFIVPSTQQFISQLAWPNSLGKPPMMRRQTFRTRPIRPSMGSPKTHHGNGNVILPPETWSKDRLDNEFITLRRRHTSRSSRPTSDSYGSAEADHLYSSYYPPLSYFNLEMALNDTFRTQGVTTSNPQPRLQV